MNECAVDKAYYIEEKVNSTMIARNNEIEAIKSHFNRVLKGESGISIISGTPGIGKTYLVERIVRELASNNITYVYGKHRKNDEKPLNAISEIIEQVVRHLLTLSNDQLEDVTNDLKRALDSDMEIITSISPYARKLIESNKAINIKDHGKLKYRIRKAIYNFLQIVSKPLFPLVIFLDDIQWADEPSLNILESICKDNESLNSLLLLACRDNEEEYIEKLKKIIKSTRVTNGTYVKLHELTTLEIKAYLELRFNSVKNIDDLASTINNLTQGNPFYIKETLYLLTREGILVYSEPEEEWTLKGDKLNKLTLSKDMQQIIKDRISKLKNEDKKLLEIIACFDGKVNDRILHKIMNVDSKVLTNQLDQLCGASFLIKKEEFNGKEESISYSLVHDIILDSVYNSLGYEQRSKTHHQIAKMLLENKEEVIVENSRPSIASHLLRSDYTLLKEENTERWIDELYYEGIKSKQTTAIEQALKIFELCSELISYSNLKEKDNELEMNINIELGECQFICGEYEESKKIFEELISKYNSVENLITIKRKYMNLYVYNRDFEKVITLGIEILNHLDFKFNVKHIKMDLLKAKSLFSNQRIEKIVNAPIIKDERLLYILETLTKMGPAANYIDEEMFQLILIKIGIISMQYGNSDYSPIGYLAFSFILFDVYKDYEKAKELKDIALKLVESMNLSTQSIIYFQLGIFLEPWLSQMEQSIHYLEKSIEEGKKSGEFLYSGYAATAIINTKYVMGVPLDEISKDIAILEKDLAQMTHDTVRFIFNIYKSHIQYLKNEITPEEEKKLEEQIQSIHNSRTLMYFALKIQRLYLEGKISEGYEIAEYIAPRLNLFKGFIMHSDVLFYCILTRLAAHENLNKVEMIKNRKLIESYIQEIESWVSICEGNHYARLLLAKAEYTTIFQQEKASERLYNEAISFAANKKQIQIEAVGNLLAAKHYKYSPKLSAFYVYQAVTLFKEWGALYIAETIEEQLLTANVDDFLPQLQKTKDDPIDDTKAYADIPYLLNEIQNMTEEEAFISVLNFLAEMSLADYCAILIEKSEEMYIQYEKKSIEKVTFYTDFKNIKFAKNLPHKIIRYAARIEEDVIINQKPSTGIFANDEYLTNKKEVSIICIPMKYLGVSVGMIYMEKHSYDVFNEEIIQTAKNLIPTLISKKETIRDVNIQNLLKPEKAKLALTKRELEVLGHTANGLSNENIAKALSITPSTVKKHLSNIYEKLEVDSRIKAVVKAKEMNIIKI